MADCCSCKTVGECPLPSGKLTDRSCRPDELRDALRATCAERDVLLALAARVVERFGGSTEPSEEALFNHAKACIVKAEGGKRVP